jgi:hypothetical protein
MSLKLVTSIQKHPILQLKDNARLCSLLSSGVYICMAIIKFIPSFIHVYLSMHHIPILLGPKTENAEQKMQHVKDV